MIEASGLCNDEANDKVGKLNPVVFPLAKLDMKHLSYIILSL